MADAVIIQGWDEAAKKAVPIPIDRAGTSLAVRVKSEMSVPTLPEVRTRGDTGARLLASVLLGATSTTIFTASAAYRDVTLIFCNVDTAARTYQASHGALDDTHSLAKSASLSVGDKDYLYIPGMASGDVLRGLCDSANKVAVQVYGVNVS